MFQIRMEADADPGSGSASQSMRIHITDPNDSYLNIGHVKKTVPALVITS